MEKAPADVVRELQHAGRQLVQAIEAVTTTPRTHALFAREVDRAADWTLEVHRLLLELEGSADDVLATPIAPSRFGAPG